MKKVYYSMNYFKDNKLIENHVYKTSVLKAIIRVLTCKKYAKIIGANYVRLIFSVEV